MQHSIGVLKGALQHRFGHLKSNEAFVGLRCVTALGGLKYIETELGLGVRKRIVRVGNRIPEFQAQLRIEQGRRYVGGHAVSVVIRRVMRQRAQGERILVQILGVANQVRDEVAAPHVMRQVAVELAAERIIAQILNDAASVGICVRRYRIIRAGGREPFQQKRPDRAIPNRIDNGLVRQHRIPFNGRTPE
jgi:hypothetical protein